MEAFRAMVPTIETIGRWVRDLVGMDEDAIARVSFGRFNAVSDGRF